LAGHTKMAQTGYTPISIYYSATTTNVPTAGNLVAGELAINTNDGKLFYKDSAGVVQTIASKATGTVAGSTTQVIYNNAGAYAGSANLTYDGTTFTATGAANFATSTGSVGVGTASPGSKLQVTSASDDIFRLVATAPYLSFYNGATRTGYIRANTAGTFGIVSENATTPMSFYTAGSEQVRIDSSGNVGIGTTSALASYKTSIQHTSGELLALNASSGTLTRIAFGNTSASLGSTQIIANGTDLALIAGSAERMRIDSSGNLFVGCTSAPASNRTKGFEAKNNSSGGIQIYQTVSNSDWAISATSGSICNFYSDNGSALVYAGNISVNGNITTYNSISDYRLKENVAPLTGALEKVSQLKPVTYTFKDGGQKSEGFIAHELQAIIPEAVTGEKDAVKEDGTPEYQGVDSSFLIATLTAAIQEQQAIIETMQSKLKDAGILGF